LIWWDEGNCVGHVQVIAESEKEFSAWGYEEPHIFVDNTHPFDPTIRIGVAHDEGCLEDEGIGLLNQREKDLFEAAMKDAEVKAVTKLKSHKITVTTECVNGQMQAWIFEIR